LVVRDMCDVGAGRLQHRTVFIIHYEKYSMKSMTGRGIPGWYVVGGLSVRVSDSSRA
jgi:hypothetical protein